MARPLRIEYEGAVYHVTSRGNKRNTIFHDDTDRLTFLNILHSVNERYNFLCHSYCLMGNHYHLIIETPDGNLSTGMRQLNGVYSQIFNKKHESVGHVLQGRYKAILLQKERYLLEVCRYIVLNPVRAGMTQTPEEWKWSSYRSMTGLEETHRCLTTEWILGQFAKRKRTAIRGYKKFVVSEIGKNNIWQNVKGQSLLGSDKFVNTLMGYVKGYEEVAEIPKSQRYINRPALNKMFNSRRIPDKLTRNDIIIDAINEYGYSQKEIANHLGLHYTSVSRLIKKTLKVKT